MFSFIDSQNCCHGLETEGLEGQLHPKKNITSCIGYNLSPFHHHLVIPHPLLKVKIFISTHNIEYVFPIGQLCSLSLHLMKRKGFESE